MIILCIVSFLNHSWVSQHFSLLGRVVTQTQRLADYSGLAARMWGAQLVSTSVHVHIPKKNPWPGSAWGLTTCELQQHCQQDCTWCWWDRSNFVRIQAVSHQILKKYWNFERHCNHIDKSGASVASLNSCFNISRWIKLHIWIWIAFTKWFESLQNPPKCELEPLWQNWNRNT